MEEKCYHALAAYIDHSDAEANAAFKLGEADPQFVELLTRRFSLREFATYASPELLQKKVGNNRKAVVEAFVMAAEAGRTDLMTWLKEKYNLTRKEMPLRGFFAGARNGHTGVVYWYVENANINRTYVGEKPLLTLFVHVCERGNTDVAEALARGFNITASQALSSEGAALVRAAANGHTETAKWLIVYFNLGLAEVWAVDLAIEAAQDNSHEATANQLAGLMRERLGEGEEEI